MTLDDAIEPVPGVGDVLCVEGGAGIMEDAQPEEDGRQHHAVFDRVGLIVAVLVGQLCRVAYDPSHQQGQGRNQQQPLYALHVIRAMELQAQAKPGAF